jgi:hypothetical protein
MARDFCNKLLAPYDERLTPALALNHPWLRGVQPIASKVDEKDKAKDMRHKVLCYSLAIMLVPVTLPFKDFDELQQAFFNIDTDQDGMIPRQHAKHILRQRCQIKDAVDAALSIADVHKSDVFDLCSVACADLIALQFFGNGPTHQPLQGPFESADLAPRMLKKFFEVFGGRQQQVTLAGLKARLRSATYREMEANAGVDYEEMMADFPDGAIDAQMLTSLISGNAGQGTPLGHDDNSKSNNEGFFSWLGLFGQCMAGGAHVQEDSPF